MIKDRIHPELIIAATLGILMLASCSRIGSLDNSLLAPTGTAQESARLSETIPVTQPEPVFSTVTPTPPLAGTVTLWHSWDEIQRQSLVQIIQEFQALNPGVQFDVLYIPVDNLLFRFQQASAEGAPPSLLLGPAEWGSQLYDQGYIAQLDQLLTADLEGNLVPPALSAGVYQGKQVGLPYAVEGITLFRNQTIIPLEAATLEELISQAKSATLGDQVGAMLERSVIFSGGHLEGLGGAMMDENGLPLFNDENGEAWIELLRFFELAGPTDFSTNQDIERFKTGKVGYIIDGIWNRLDLATAIGAGNLAIDSFPAYRDGRLAGYVQSEQVFLSNQLERSQRTVAEKFIEFFLTPASQAKIVADGRIPANMATQISDPLITQAVKALSKGVPYPTHPAFSIYIDPLNAALKSVFEGQTTPEEALLSAYQVIYPAVTGQATTPTP